jgi:Chlorite dismutase
VNQHDHLQPRSSAVDAEYTGAVKAQSTTKTGDPIEIWVDNNGAQVDKLTRTTRATLEAVTGALVIWISVILAFESPDASRIVDMMRDLRAVESRRHVRMETPFFSGPRTDLHLLVSCLP